MAKKKKISRPVKTGTARIISQEECEGAKIFENAPEYINLNGWVYERHSKAEDGVNLALDFDDDSLQIIDDHMKNNPGYVNRQEVLREAIRLAIKNKTFE